MGLDSAVDDGSLASQEDMTIRELKEHFGGEVVRRGIQYMQSLKEADKNFRESADSKKMEEGYKKAAGTLTGGESDGNDEDELPESVQEGSNKWASNMEDSGLGLDDE